MQTTHRLQASRPQPPQRGGLSERQTRETAPGRGRAPTIATGVVNPTNRAGGCSGGRGSLVRGTTSCGSACGSAGGGAGGAASSSSPVGRRRPPLEGQEIATAGQLAELWKQLEQVQVEAERRLELVQVEAERERSLVEVLRKDNARLQRQVKELSQELAVSGSKSLLHDGLATAEASSMPGSSAEDASAPSAASATASQAAALRGVDAAGGGGAAATGRGSRGPQQRSSPHGQRGAAATVPALTMGAPGPALGAAPRAPRGSCGNAVLPTPTATAATVTTGSPRQ